MYLQTDHLGTPRAATDGAKRVVWRWEVESDAFGVAGAQQDPDGDGIATIIHLRFPGQYYDAESGLFYNWNRYYDSSLGRYISSDPIGLAGGLNTFGYVDNAPVNLIDINGLLGAAPGHGPYKPNEGPGAGLIGWTAVQAYADFIYNFNTLQLAHQLFPNNHDQLIGLDKYLHCKANCEATREGGDIAEATACELSDFREWFDQTVKRSPAKDSVSDQYANAFGRFGATHSNLSCNVICGGYRPPFHYSLSNF